MAPPSTHTSHEVDTANGKITDLWVSTSNFIRNKFYEFRTFIAICKDEAAINCITVQDKKD
jgi:hypothetical protein